MAVVEPIYMADMKKPARIGTILSVAVYFYCKNFEHSCNYNILRVKLRLRAIKTLKAYQSSCFTVVVP